MTDARLDHPVSPPGNTIDTLPLSNRTRARLREAGVLAVEELSEKSDDFLLGLRGFGHTCLREVRSVLAVMGDQGSEPLLSAQDQKLPTDVSESLLSTPLQNLPISNRARGVFRREGIATVADYLAFGQRALLTLRNFGETSFHSVNRAVHAADRTLHDRKDGDDIPFHPPERLAGNLRLGSNLAQVPVAALDLPRRARRACQEMGLRTLKDLTHISYNDLLHCCNFGQATLRRIQSEMDRFLRRQTELTPDSFASTLNQLLDRLQPKERQLIELREGLEDGKSRTLTEAGLAMHITESRACQIEHSAWAKLRRFSAGVTEPTAEVATQILMRKGGVAAPEALLNDPYFRGGDLPAIFVGRMLARLLPHRLAQLSDGRLAAVPAATLSTLAARLRKRLRHSGESLLLEQLGGDVLRGLESGPEQFALVRAMCEVLFHREVICGPDGETVVRTPAQGLGDDLRRVLLKAGQAQHFGEIARQLALPPYLRTELTDEKVRLRLCRDRRFVLVRRGLYDLTERFRIDPSLRAALTARALQTLQQMKRPASVALLGAELRREDRFRGVSEFVLAAVMREDERFIHLGRGTFVPAGSGRTSVVHVSEILRRILDEGGGPMTYAELRQKVQEERHVSDGAISATLVGRLSFLRVARGVFDLASRYPFDVGARARIAEEAGLLMDGSVGVLSLNQLHQRLSTVRELTGDPPGAILVGDLLRRQGGFLFLGGGFVCRADGPLEGLLSRGALRVLAEAGEPLRPTTIARRLELGAGATALLRRVLRDDPRFRAHPEGRFSRA